MSEQMALMIPDNNRALMVVDQTKAAEIACLFAWIHFWEVVEFLLDADVEDSSNE